MTRVKICGLTNLGDARAAIEAGADFLGFILYAPSKRSVSPDEVRLLAGRLRDRPRCPMLVGVFVDETAESIAGLLEYCRLDLAQLSGSEPAALVGDPVSPIYGRCYKALRPRTATEAEAEAEWYLPPLTDDLRPGLLLDAYHPTLYGGTGETADWQLASGLASHVPNLMLAGGLKPDNVSQAIAQVQPFAVDVASGVESEPGRKDHQLLRAFFDAVRQTDRRNLGR